MLRYDSADFETSEEAFAVYCRAISDVLDATRIEGDHRPFEARVQAWSVGALFVHCGDHMAIRWDRSADRVRADGLDDIKLLISFRGQWRGNFDGMRRTIRPGEIVIVDRSLPVCLEGDDTRSLMVNFPRRELEGLGVDTRAVHGLVLDGERARMLAAVLAEIDAAGIAEFGRDALAAVLCLLTAAALAPDAIPPSEQRPSLLEMRARQLIDQRIGDEDFTPADLAVSLAVSRASLYRCFEPHGGIRAFISRRRLEVARDLLRQRADSSIAQIAFEVGFRSAAHFSAAFRRQFGSSPRDVTRGTARGSAPPNALAANVRINRWKRLVDEGSGR